MTVEGSPAGPAESVSSMEEPCWFSGWDHAGGVLEGTGPTDKRLPIGWSRLVEDTFTVPWMWWPVLSRADLRAGSRGAGAPSVGRTALRIRRGAAVCHLSVPAGVSGRARLCPRSAGRPVARCGEAGPGCRNFGGRSVEPNRSRPTALGGQFIRLRVVNGHPIEAGATHRCLVDALGGPVRDQSL